MRRVSRRSAIALLSLGAAACVASALGVGGLLLLRRRPAPAATLVPTPAATLPPQPIIVPRAAWGARPPNHEAPNERGFAAGPLEDSWWVYPGLLSDIYTTVVIHHTAQQQDTPETMVDVQNLHMNRNGWADIGYHFGIDVDGNIYEGRDIGVRGASVAGYNTGLIGVALMGNFEVEQPTPAQLAAAQALTIWLAAVYTLTHLAGHGEFNGNTACPGANLKTQLDALATTANLLRGTGGYISPSTG
jgi:hypothetical protein